MPVLSPLRFRFCVLATALSLGCGAQQRAAEKLIDPQLRAQGLALEHYNDGSRREGRSRRGDLDLGGYRVSAFDLRDEDFDGTGPLAGDGRTRPTQQLRMRFELSTPEGARWASNCVAQRRQPPDHDLAAAADELRDEIALRCELEGPLPTQTRWVLSVDGDLGSNLLGRLQLEGQDSLQTVEILMWHQLLDLTKRHLPASLALIRSEVAPQAGSPSHTAAALILDSPERAWLARELDADQRGLAMVALLSLRLIPLGFDT